MSSDHNLQNSHDIMQSFLMPPAPKTERTVDEVKALLNISSEYIKVSDLENDVEYDITNGKIINTVHGDRVQFVLNDTYKLLMPDRYAKLITDVDIQKLVSGKIKLVYKGKKDIYKGQTKHEFLFI